MSPVSFKAALSLAWRDVDSRRHNRWVYGADS
jgi:hypothetical protein